MRKLRQLIVAIKARGPTCGSSLGFGLLDIDLRWLVLGPGVQEGPVAL